MDREPDVYDSEKLYGFHSQMVCYQDHIVDIVCMKGTDTLEQQLYECLEDSDDKKSAQYADILLAEFIHHCVLDGFREVEAPLGAAYKPFEEALQKQKDARLATEQAMQAWQVRAEDFRLKLKELGKWAESAARERHRRRYLHELNPFAFMTVVGTASWLKTPGDFVKYHDAVFREIDFIHEMSAREVIEGRLERPVRLSDFESSLKAFESAQARVEACLNEDAKAEAAREAASLKYNEERQKAITVLAPLSEAGRWALFRLFSLKTESPEAG